MMSFSMMFLIDWFMNANIALDDGLMSLISKPFAKPILVHVHVTTAMCIP